MKRALQCGVALFGVVLSGLAACGSPQETECTNLVSQAPPVGVLSSPAEFDQSSCNPATLDGQALSGSYYGGGLKFRIQTCGADRFELRGLGRTGLDTTYLNRSDAGFFVRTSTGVRTTGLLICGDNGDGTFHGLLSYCGPNQDGETECSRTIERTFVPFGRIDGEDERDGLRLVAEIRETDDVPWDTSYVSNVEYDDGLVFVSLRNEGLRIFDVADRENPREVGFVPRLAINDIKAFRVGAQRYVALADEETTFVNVTNPSAPRIVGSLGVYSHRIEVDVSAAGEPRLYVGAVSGLVDVYSLIDPAAPKLLVQVPLPMGQFPGMVHALTVKDEILYVAGGYTRIIC